MMFIFEFPTPEQTRTCKRVNFFGHFVSAERRIGASGAVCSESLRNHACSRTSATRAVLFGNPLLPRVHPLSHPFPANTHTHERGRRCSHIWAPVNCQDFIVLP
jgi:hypothetical protein